MLISCDTPLIEYIQLQIPYFQHVQYKMENNVCVKNTR